MVPALARRGTYLVYAAGAFIVIGALRVAPPLVALGGLALAALMSAYLWFFPAAILLRRRKVELSWWVPPGDGVGGALAADRPFALVVALRNHGARRLRVLDLEILASGAVEPPRGIEALMPPGRQVELVTEVVARAAGYQVLHGAVLRFGDVLGLFEMRAYFPNPIAVKVFPREVAVTGRPTAAVGAPRDQRGGRHVLRRRGIHGDLREIREHGPGDPFKRIAWKPTARRRRLMVRDLETETARTHQLVLDIGGAMRSGAPGQRKLDAGIELCAGLARGALAEGDRVGLVTYDTRVFSALAPHDGRRHLLAITDRLLDVQHVVDDDLTDLTSGELVAAVAAYLANQEAVDVRVGRAPALDDPAWQTLQAGPTGELFDLEALGRAVTALLAAMREAQADQGLTPAWWWQRVEIAPGGDPREAPLRLFARLRGLELPYRREAERGRRAAGLAEALRKASETRLDSLVVVSDLAGLAEAPSEPLAALARARRAGAHVVVVAPLEAPRLAPPRSASAGRVLAALRADEDARLEEARRMLASAGVKLVRGTGSPSPTPENVSAI